MTSPTESVDTTAPEGVATQPVGQAGIRVDITESKAATAGSAAGFGVLLLALAMFGYGVYAIIAGAVSADAGGPAGLVVVGIVMIVLSVIPFSCLTVIAPGMTSVRQFFGRYIGTVRRTGLVLVPPLTSGKKVSVKVHNFETNELKVNDLDGNPINIAAIVVWQVADTARAVFAVEEYEEFIKTQAEAALRHVATTHPYDQPEKGETSLRGGTDEVSAELAAEVAARVAIAGLEIVEVRISTLAYAPEIAQAMLQRQQAGAIIAARELIVEGAVTMVEQALTRLEDEEIVVFDDERRAQMVSNLLVVLTSEQRATPIINAGSLYA
ncbi:MAG: SPFH domain-containing protein [Propioniciclava sp.]|uniref:SPFH domain-containing protein n=1 Tax=Propioniciclava sp. TaxID=2038686 RepID=UPI0039E4CAAA